MIQRSVYSGPAIASSQLIPDGRYIMVDIGSRGWANGLFNPVPSMVAGPGYILLWQFAQS